MVAENTQGYILKVMQINTKCKRKHLENFGIKEAKIGLARSC